MAKEKNQEVATSTVNTSEKSTTRWESFMGKDFSSLTQSVDIECENLSRTRIQTLLSVIVLSMLWDIKNESDRKFSDWLGSQNPEINSIFWGTRKSVDLVIRYMNHIKPDSKAKNFILKDIFLNEELYNHVVNYFLDVGEKMLGAISDTADPDFSLKILTDFIGSRPDFDVKSMQYLIKTYNYKNYPRIKFCVDFKRVKKEATDYFREQKFGKENNHTRINKTFLSQGINIATNKLYDLINSHGIPVTYKENKILLSNDQVGNFNTNKDLKPELQTYTTDLISALNNVLENYFANLTK